MKFAIIIDTDRLKAGEEGRQIAAALRATATEMEGGHHFQSENHVNGRWGAAAIKLNGEPIGVMEIV